MKHESLEKLMLDHLDGRLTPEQEEKLIRLLREAGREDELGALKSIVHDLDAVRPTEPGPGLNRKFYQMLGRFQQKKEQSPISRIIAWLQKRNVQKAALRFAFSVVLVFIGWFAGQRFSGSGPDRQLVSMSAEIHQMKYS